MSIGARMTIPVMSLLLASSSGPAVPLPLERGVAPSQAALRVTTLVSNLDTPWDLAWGPDGSIWVTERRGTISRVHPATGAVTRVGEIEVVEVSESGLMGMAFHPDFASQPYLYVAHSYGSRGAIRNRLVRMRYDGARLGRAEVLLDAIPGNSYHDGSRLAFGPDRMLYMTTGDAGNRASAQDLGSLGGKVLRVTATGAAAPGNPFATRVYSYGHRNPQGIVFHPETGALYVAEHGPRDNDEVSRVAPGGNHGWPHVSGFCDGDTDGERAYCAAHTVIEPLAAWTPTVGMSGLDYYGAELIPEWSGSLLVTSLRGAALYRLRLADGGGRVVEREELFRGEYGRLRDVMVGPEGEVYLATSNRDGRGRPASDDDRILVIRP